MWRGNIWVQEGRGGRGARSMNIVRGNCSMCIVGTKRYRVWWQMAASTVEVNKAEFRRRAMSGWEMIRKSRYVPDTKSGTKWSSTSRIDTQHCRPAMVKPWDKCALVCSGDEMWVVKPVWKIKCPNNNGHLVLNGVHKSLYQVRTSKNTVYTRWFYRYRFEKYTSGGGKNWKWIELLRQPAWHPIWY